MGDFFGGGGGCASRGDGGDLKPTDQIALLYKLKF